MYSSAQKRHLITTQFFFSSVTSSFLLHLQTKSLVRAGFPYAKAYAGMSVVTTLPAPIKAYSPMLTPQTITVPAPIEAKIIELKEVPTKLKGTPMLGFLGTFSVNFEIPDYWGIGKSVSRGFGTVLRN